MKLSEALKGVVRVGAVDCDDESELCSRHKCAGAHCTRGRGLCASTCVMRFEAHQPLLAGLRTVQLCSRCHLVKLASWTHVTLLSCLQPSAALVVREPEDCVDLRIMQLKLR